MKKSISDMTQILVLLPFTLTIAACMNGVSPPSEDRESAPIEQVVEAPVSASELELGFQRSDATDIVYVLNEVKKSPPNFDVIQRISCAYTTCDAEENAWSWDDLSSPIVRVNLIDVLVQAKHNGIDTVDQEQLKAEAVTLLSNANPLVVQRSLMILAYIDSPSDVPMIENVARQTTNEVTFRVAIIALQLMSNSEAKAAIGTVLQDASAKQREMVADLIKE